MRVLDADYLKDFMTATFSHPSMDGFLFWNFWDGATWRNGGTNLFRLDWSMSQPGEAFVDLVFREWWTDETVYTNSDGTVSPRVFKGLYEISYECNGMTVKDTVNITEDASYEISCNNITTDIDLPNLDSRVEIFPNPSSGIVNIHRSFSESATIRVFDLNGRMLKEFISKEMETSINMKGTKGVYVLEISSIHGRLFEKVILTN